MSHDETECTNSWMNKRTDEVIILAIRSERGYPSFGAGKRR